MRHKITRWLTTQSEARPKVANTPLRQDLWPEDWREHRFGMSENRWQYLNGKSVWVTGAGTGYGRSMAVALAAAGCQVFLTGRRRSKLEATLSEMNAYGIPTRKCHLVPADLLLPQSMDEVCAQVMNSCETLYGLIHNAALPSEGNTPLQNEPLEVWQRRLMLNVTAPWYISRLILPHMLKGASIRILFMSSEAGWAFTPGFGPYNLSKAALNNLSTSLAEEVATTHPGTDVQINAIVPGEARTEMNQGSSNSPYMISNLVLALLSHPKSGPNGKFFHRDGRHLSFGYSEPYSKSIL